MSTATVFSPLHVGVVGAPRLVAPRTRLRLTRRGRAVLMALTALPLAAIVAVPVLSSGGAVADGSVGSSTVQLQYVTVQAGDTLWSIASRIAPNSDPRDVVDELVRLNGLTSGAIQIGQQLALPTNLR